MSKFVANSFQVPNAVIDELMAELSGAELKCYLFVLRKTKGWNKDEDAISVSQFMEACNLSNRKVIDACNRLVELGLLEQKTGRNKVKVFSVQNYSSEESSLVKKVHNSSEESSLSVVKKVHTQNNNTKNTTQNTNTNLAVSSARAKSDDLALLEQYGIIEQLAKDFITHRKSCKAPITETAMNGFLREAQKAGITIQQAVEISIERGWRGFRADWDWQGGQKFAKNPQNSTANKLSVHTGFAARDYGQTVVPDWAEGV